MNWTVIGELLMRIINFILQKKEKTEKDIVKDENKQKDQERLQFNIELEKAIKEGNGEKIAELYEKKKNYPYLTIILFLCLTMTSCKTSHVPLFDSGIPYQLPAGKYIDSKGIVHIENNVRWSVSERWLYDSIKK